VEKNSIAIVAIQTTNTQIHKYKYTNTQINKYTNTQIHKYTNTQIHKYLSVKYSDGKNSFEIVAIPTTNTGR